MKLLTVKIDRSLISKVDVQVKHKDNGCTVIKIVPTVIDNTEEEPEPDADILAEMVINNLLATEFSEFDDKDEELIQSWSREEKRQALEWSHREQLIASDDDLPRITCPPHVEELKKRPRDWQGNYIKETT